MAQDLQADVNHLSRLFSKFSSEYKAVSIAAVAVIASILALLMAWIATYDAIHAKIQIEVVLESNADLKKEVRILQIKVDRYEAKLNAQGEK